MATFITKCPICGKGDIVKERHFLSSKVYCTNCYAEFAIKGNKLKIVKFPLHIDASIEKRLKERIGEWHTLSDWTNIVQTGYTERERIYKNALQGNLPALHSTSVNVILSKGEVAFLKENSTLFEPRSVRTYTGTTGSVSLPIPGSKGARYRAGGFNGTSESHEELRKIDNGILLLTNKRLIFSGRNNVRTIKLSKIVYIYAYSDAVRVSVDGRKRPFYFDVSDTILWRNAIKGLAEKAE